MAAPTVIVLRDRAGMGAIVPAWEDLAANALEAHPVYEPWILRAALAHTALRALLRWAVEQAAVLEFLYLPAAGAFDDALRTVAKTIVRTARFSRALLVKGSSAE